MRRAAPSRAVAWILTALVLQWAGCSTSVNGIGVALEIDPAHDLVAGELALFAVRASNNQGKEESIAANLCAVLSAQRGLLGCGANRCPAPPGGGALPISAQSILVALPASAAVAYAAYWAPATDGAEIVFADLYATDCAHVTGRPLAATALSFSIGTSASVDAGGRDQAPGVNDLTTGEQPADLVAQDEGVGGEAQGDM